jgi:DNA-binding transcriptional MerR regulator
LLRLHELADLLGVESAVLRRLVRAGLISTVESPGSGQPQVRDTDYSYVRLLVDLGDAGLSLDELRDLVDAAPADRKAAEASRVLIEIIDRALPVVTAKVEGVRRIREDLIRSRQALERCHACHKPILALACRDCGAMAGAPRVVDELFLPDRDDE